MSHIKFAHLAVCSMLAAALLPACTADRTDTSDSPVVQAGYTPPEAAEGHRLLLALDAEPNSEVSGQVSLSLAGSPPMTFQAINANLQLVDEYAGEVYLLSPPLNTEEASLMSAFQFADYDSFGQVDAYSFIQLIFHDGQLKATNNKYRMRPFLWIEDGGDVDVAPLMPEVN